MDTTPEVAFIDLGQWPEKVVSVASSETLAHAKEHHPIESRIEGELMSTRYLAKVKAKDGSPFYIYRLTYQRQEGVDLFDFPDLLVDVLELEFPDLPIITVWNPPNLRHDMGERPPF